MTHAKQAHEKLKKIPAHKIPGIVGRSVVGLAIGAFAWFGKDRFPGVSDNVWLLLMFTSGVTVFGEAVRYPFSILIGLARDFFGAMRGNGRGYHRGDGEVL